MLKFEVGEPLPLPLTPPMYEMCQSSTNEALFDVVYWIPSDTNLQRSIKAWTKSPIRYGVFVAKDIPFFIVDFVGENWNFDVTTNIHKVTEDKVEAWLNSKGNIVNLYLCNCNTKELYAMRIISLQESACNAIRDACEKQDENYRSAVEVDKAISRIMDAYTTADMIQKCKMYRL